MDDRPLVVFQDKRRLRTGGRFDLQFMASMCKATVIVLLVSWDALKRMTALKIDSDCDNVLLEWYLAYRLNERFGTVVVPLLIGPETVNLFPARTEEEVFAALGLEYREPTNRDCTVQPIGQPMLPAPGAEGAEDVHPSTPPKRAVVVD